MCCKSTKYQTQSTEEPQRESLRQSEQESWKREPRNVSSGLDTCCVRHLHYCDICLHNHGKQVTLWLSALEAEWGTRAWVLLQGLLLQEGTEATLKVETQPHSWGVFRCPVLSWRVCDQAPDRWKGWGSEPGTCVKELDSRKFPESAWPSLKVLSRSCSPLRRRLCLELFFFTMVISRGSHFIHSSNWMVNYGQDHNRWWTKKGAYLLWQTQRTSQHHQ